MSSETLLSPRGYITGEGESKPAGITVRGLHFPDLTEYYLSEVGAETGGAGLGGAALSAAGAGAPSITACWIPIRCTTCSCSESSGATASASRYAAIARSG